MSTKAYTASGVDVDLANQLKTGIKRKIKSTLRPEVLSQIGGFGGLFSAKFSKYRNPVLVSSIDGVGTKLKVAGMLNKHDTIGQDLVNHCVNDIAVLGAEPLFFLDYFGTAHLDKITFHHVLGGLASACKKAGCALIGGETAQMPGVYHGDDYDLVGTIIGVVDKGKIIDGSKIRPGDQLIGFPSSGLHTNGYSLARSILFDKLRMRLEDPFPGTSKSLGDILLQIHINYQPLLKTLAKNVTFKGLCHITGGGFLDNIPRILPQKTDVEIFLGSWPTLPVFKVLQEEGEIPEEECYQAFNMGIGMIAILSPADAKKILAKTKAYHIGQVIPGKQRVRLVR